MSVLRDATFNVNQFSGVAHQQADLRVRMANADIIGVQESVDLDLVAFAASVPGWGAFQIRHGDNDGHANTGVLYRLEGGPITDDDCTFLVDTKGERRRFLTGVKQGGVWYWSAHINPKRFSSGISTQLAHIGAWVKAHPGPQVGHLDRNQCPPGALENATGLKWHGVGIDGFLTNLPVANVLEFPKGFSDHPGVHADVTLPDPPKEEPVPTLTGLQKIRALLRKSIAWLTKHGKKGEARRRQAALDALRKHKPQPKPEPAPTPAPTPAVDPAPVHGFLPANLPDLLRKHGLKVVEVPGWKTRGRPASTGGFNPGGVLCHDTVTSKATSDAAVVKLLVDGRSDLPGPLAQFGLARDGTVYIVAAGRCNHAGVAKPAGTMKGGDGNELYAGVEAFNAGTGEPWPKAQYDAYWLLAAVLCVEVTGNSFHTVNGHKETSVTGKIDPFGPTPDGPTFDMDKFRGRVADAIKAMKA